MARIWVSQGIRSMRYRERRLSSSSRRWSKASSDGSFKANIARADMRASAREMVGLPGRGSARFFKASVDQGNQGIGRKMLPWQERADHGNLPGLLLGAAQNVPSIGVYERRIRL